MCLIIQCNKTIPLNKPLVEHWLERNGDGWGMMWIENNTMQTYKSMEAEALWDKYQETAQFDPVIHLRWRTHGDTDLANCHPFYCGHGIFLMHNGVIHDADARQKEKSDTWHFVEDWIKGVFDLSKNPHTTMRSPIFRKLLEKAVGYGNRIILGDRGGFVLFNTQQWHTISNELTDAKGLLVSNDYAWDAKNYGKPPIPVQAYYYGAQSNSYPHHAPAATTRNEPIPHIDGSFRNTIGQKMALIVGNIYMNEDLEVWLFCNGAFIRQAGLDKPMRKRLKKEAKKDRPKQESSSAQASLLLPAPEILSPTVDSGMIPINAPDDGDDRDAQAENIINLSQEEYNDILVKSWRQESKAAIHSKVYSEPDDAAIVLCHLLDK